MVASVPTGKCENERGGHVEEIVDVEASPVYRTDYGATFHDDSLQLLENLPDDSIDLIVTSPPFALQHEKEYGNKDQSAYNDWFMKFIPEIKRVLQPHGSLIVEIGGAFKKGWPERSIYQWKLLTRIVEEGELKFAQDWYWYNPSKLPSPIEWVNVRKLRGVDAVTHIWWFSKELNKDPAFTEELQEKYYIIKSIREYSEKLTDEQLYSITEAILSGDVELPDEYEQTTLEESSEIYKNGDGSPSNGDQTPVEWVQSTLLSVRNKSEQEWVQDNKVSDHVRSILSFGEDKSEKKYYTTEDRDVIASVFSPYLALKIHELIVRSNKTPQPFKNNVLKAIEQGEEISRPYPKPEVNNQRNRSVLSNYSEDQQELIETGEYNEGKRSSGHNIGEDSFSNDNDGSIPKNVITASNTASNTHYQRACRKYGLDRHPARFPKDIPEKFVNLLTPDPPYDDWARGDQEHVGYLDRPIVLDIFGGSNWTGSVTEDHDRYWLSFEKNKEYAVTSEFRFLEEEKIEDSMRTEAKFRQFVPLDDRPGPLWDYEPFCCNNKECEKTYYAHPDSNAAFGYCSPKCQLASDN